MEHIEETSPLMQETETPQSEAPLPLRLFEDRKQFEAAVEALIGQLGGQLPHGIFY